MFFVSREFASRAALLVAVCALIFGAKLRLIDQYGSDVPYWDQWDAEAENLFQAQAEHSLGWENFVRPHNEHRPVLTRFLALGLFQLNDRQWDPRLEQVVDAALHVAVAALLLALVAPLLPPPALLGYSALLVVFFGTDVSWENTLSGFQSQFYFVTFFSLLQLALTFGTRPGTRAWWLAPLAGGAALFSMASGLLMALAILAVTALEAGRRRRLTRESAYVLGSNLVLAAAGWALKHEVPGHAVLKASSVGNFLDSWRHQLAWPVTTNVGWAMLLGLLPPLVFLVATLRGTGPARRGPVALGLLAASAWVVLQTLAIAYARGGAEHGYSSRYVDSLALGLLINVAALAYLARTAGPRPARGALTLAALGVAVVAVLGLRRESRHVGEDLLRAMPAVQTARATTVRDYLRRPDPAFFQKIPWDELPYPSADRLAQLLDRPAIRAVLPPSVQPGIALRPEAESARRGFAADPAGPADALPGRAPQDLGQWGDLADGPGEFRSEPFRVTHARLSFFVATAPDPPGFQLRLLDPAGNVRRPLQENVAADAHWHRVNFAVPPGQYRLVVTKFGGGWLRFTNPLEDTPLSRATLALVHEGNGLLGAGILSGLLALGLLRPPLRERIPRAARDLGQDVYSLVPDRQSCRRALAWLVARRPDPPARPFWIVLAALLVTGTGAVLTRTHPPVDVTFGSALCLLGFSGALLATLWFPLAAWLHARAALPDSWVPLLATAVVAALGYVLFWVFYASPAGGKILAVALVAGGLAACARPRAVPRWHEPFWAIPSLQLGLGLFYVAGLFLYAVPGDLYAVARDRIIPGLPADNELPYFLGRRLFEGASLRPFVGDWLASDRPPLESGWQLLTWPFGGWLRLSDTTFSCVSGLWLQLAWVAAVVPLLRHLGLATSRAVAWAAAMGLTGFCFLNSVFIWPKLSAGAFALGTFALWVLQPAPARERPRRLAWGGLLAGVGWVSHGGVAFSLLPLAAWAAWRLTRGEWRSWAGAAGAALALAAPWFCYQHFADPPGDRLLKWHLAGQVPVTPAGFLETVRAAYGRHTWDEIIALKRVNFRIQIPTPWHPIWNFGAAGAKDRGADQFYHVGAAVSWWLAGLGALGLGLAIPRARTALLRAGRNYLLLAAWVAATLTFWCLLMFGENTNPVVHQSSYAMVLALFVVLSGLIDLLGWPALVAVAALQAATLVSTFLIAKPPSSGTVLDATAAAFLAGVFLLLGAWLVRLQREQDPAVMSAPPGVP